MAYEVVVKDGFLKDFFELPRAVQAGAQRSIDQFYRDPFRVPDVKRVFKHQYNNVYRLRVGRYRLIYAVGGKVVSLLAVGPRGSIYDRFRAAAETSVTSGEIRAAGPQPAPYRTTPFDTPRGEYPDGAGQSTAAAEEAAEETDGVFALLLERWGIPPEQRALIKQCEGLDDLFTLDLPEDTMKKVLHWYHPPNLQQLEEEPDLDLPSPAHLERFSDGTLTRFLLKLSPEQERVAARSLVGPALVKGGPGTGKSLVALYRIKNLLDPDQYRLFEPLPRILFLTFGRSLMNASRQLLAELIPDRLEQVEITNIDRLVRQIVTAGGQPFAPLNSIEQYVVEAQNRVLAKYEAEPARAWVTLLGLSPAYLIEEFQWVIEGRQVRSLSEYLQIERTGRRVPFGADLRTLVWEVYEQAQQLMAPEGHSWEYYRGLALDALRQKRVDFLPYDVVLVDEAQDLSPVSLSIAAQLCRSPRGLFFTADANQSIYNRGFSWSKVHHSLDFRGRSTILRHNYRSTKQIAAACAELLPAEGIDNETRVAQPVREGPRPRIFLCSSQREQAARIAHFLRQSAADLRLPVWTGTVLAYSNRLAVELADALRELGIEAKHVSGGELHLRERVVKVMTLHTSKGLEFPTVAVAHVERDYFPGTGEEVRDEGEARERECYRRQILFVGCSRAMRRLALFACEQQASPFLAELQTLNWDFAAEVD